MRDHKGKQPPAKKNSNAKQKVKKPKPKQLQRKMDQQSHALVAGDNTTGWAGTNGVDLEGETHHLMGQLEEYKKLKQPEAAPNNKVEAGDDAANMATEME